MPVEINRRQMLQAAGAAAAVGILGTPRSVQPASRAKIESISVISRQPQYYHGWPTVARRRNGELLLVCSGGRARWQSARDRIGEVERNKELGRSMMRPSAASTAWSS